MSGEEKSSLTLIEWRLNRIDVNVDQLIESNKDMWKLMSEHTAQKEHMKNMQQSVESIDKTLSSIWKKHDELAKVVLPKHESWSETASNQKKVLFGIALMFLTSLGAVLGLK